ncbi:MAG: ACP S-malonyltransferase [Leptospirales bacterium]|jgi:[acyl-carrier-protein] S-malonyltransferase
MNPADGHAKNDKTWVALFPGQGSQAIGMGRDFFDAGGVAREVFEEANEIFGKDLGKLCFRGPISKLSNTDNLQIAITTVNIAIYEELRATGWPAPSAALGHSVGEYSALYAAGVISRSDALRATRERGRLMQREAKLHSGSMYAIKNTPARTIEELIQELGLADDVIIGNDNGPGQQVVSGATEGVRALVNRLMADGVECIKLPVSGAWHSPLMAGASEDFARCLNDVRLSAPKIPVITNLSADFATDPGRIRADMVAHLTGKVRWQDSMRRLLGEEYATTIEIGPGRVLTRLAAKLAQNEGVKLAAVGVESKTDLEQLSAALLEAREAPTSRPENESLNPDRQGARA